MKSPSVVSSQLLSNIGQYYDKACIIMEPVKSKSPSGAIQRKDWQAVTGLDSIPCRLASAVMKRANNEVRTPEGTYVVAPYEASLAGSYPQIKEEWRAQIDGTDYDIILVSPDSAGVTTHLALKIVR